MRCLFLLGAHRSGTTWLHQLLATSPELAFLSYADIRQQLLPYKEPLSVEQFEKELQVIGSDRGFDGVALGAHLPEEYGFVLEQRGLDLYANRPVSNKNFSPLRSLVEHKQWQHPNLPFLLLKNPSDFYDGFLPLVEAFPDCAFIFLHRHPMAVFRSQVLASRQLASTRNAYLASLDTEYGRMFDDPVRQVAMQFALHSREGLERIVLALAEACNFQLAHQDSQQVDHIGLRYEDLCADPEAQLARLCCALGLRMLAAPSLRLSPQPRELKDDPLIQEVFTEHANRFKLYSEWQGYSLDGKERA